MVTGASSGIGLELAKEFARNGCDVLIAAEDDLTSAASEIEALGATVETCQADLATPVGVETVAERARGAGRPLDIVALNAGIGVGGRFLETPLDQELKLIDLNVRSTVHLAKLLLPGMVARGQGRLLITSSIAAVAATPYARPVRDRIAGRAEPPARSDPPHSLTRLAAHLSSKRPLALGKYCVNFR